MSACRSPHYCDCRFADHRITGTQSSEIIPVRLIYVISTGETGITTGEFTDRQSTPAYVTKSRLTATFPQGHTEGSGLISDVSATPRSHGINGIVGYGTLFTQWDVFTEPSVYEQV